MKSSDGVVSFSTAKLTVLPELLLLISSSNFAISKEMRDTENSLHSPGFARAEFKLIVWML